MAKKTKSGSKKGKGKKGKSVMPEDFDLNDLDHVMRLGYEKVKEELETKEQELNALKAERDELAARAAGLEAYLGIDNDKQVGTSAPAPKKSSSKKSSKSKKGKKQKGRRGRRKRGELWDDIVSVMTGKGKMKASQVIDALLAEGYKDDDRTRTRIYNSLGRWAREGKIKKPSRGVYTVD